MLDLIIRCLATFATILGFYGLILLWIYWDQITLACHFCSKYGYAWSIGWDLAGTQIYIDKRLKR